jgi:hypothetical protein
VNRGCEISLGTATNSSDNVATVRVYADSTGGGSPGSIVRENMEFNTSHTLIFGMRHQAGAMNRATIKQSARVKDKIGENDT